MKSTNQLMTTLTAVAVGLASLVVAGGFMATATLLLPPSLWRAVFVILLYVALAAIVRIVRAYRSP